MRLLVQNAGRKTLCLFSQEAIDQYTAETALGKIGRSSYFSSSERIVAGGVAGGGIST